MHTTKVIFCETIDLEEKKKKEEEQASAVEKKLFYTKKGNLKCVNQGCGK